MFHAIDAKEMTQILFERLKTFNLRHTDKPKGIKGNTYVPSLDEVMDRYRRNILSINDFEPVSFDEEVDTITYNGIEYNRPVRLGKLPLVDDRIPFVEVPIKKEEAIPIKKEIIKVANIEQYLKPKVEKSKVEKPKVKKPKIKRKRRPKLTEEERQKVIEALVLKRQGRIEEGKRKIEFRIERKAQKLKEKQERKQELDNLKKEWKPKPVEIKNLSHGLVGVKQSYETIQKRIRSNTGKKRSDESRKRMSAAQKGRILSDEHKKAIGEKQRAYRERKRQEKLSS